MALFNREAEKGVRPLQPAPAHPASPLPALASDGGTAVQPAPGSAAAPRAAAAAEARAYLDCGSKVSGKLYFESPVRLDGQVEGEIAARESLVIGESAVITAQIKGALVVIAGKVSGDVTATQKIEIRPSAKVLGNLSTPVLVIQEGALFEGHCAMQPESAPEGRKVTVFPKEERLANAGGQKPA